MTEGKETSYSEIYRASVFIVDMARRKPKIPHSKGLTICQNRSPARSECLEKADSMIGGQFHGTDLDTANPAKVATNQGGAQRRSVNVRPYPIVSARVGK